MQKSKRVIESLDFGIFPGKALFSCGFTPQEISNYLKKSSPEWYKAYGEIMSELIRTNPKARVDKFFFVTEKQERIYYNLYIRDPFKFTDHEMAVLAHECVHLCQFHLEDILDIRKEYECFAYLHTHLMEQCLKKLR